MMPHSGACIKSTTSVLPRCWEDVSLYKEYVLYDMLLFDTFFRHGRSAQLPSRWIPPVTLPKQARHATYPSISLENHGDRHRTRKKLVVQVRDDGGL
jgi:hypothetical protein